jgi:chorismate-pyruvate lyase
VKQDADQGRFLDDDMLDELRPERHERIAHRCVRLVRGLVVLVEADNWFIPDRLPPEVRDLLEATDVPFGAAVARLQPSRRTYFVRFAELSYAEKAGTAGAPAGLSPAMPILEHRAVVLDRNGQPLSAVSERYCAALLSGVGAPLQAMGERESWRRWLLAGASVDLRRR